LLLLLLVRLVLLLVPAAIVGSIWRRLVRGR
jgi:hypothetical protein